MPDSGEASQKTRRRMSSHSWILLGLLSGVLCGLFFGEYCAPLSLVGGAFVDLLQMTVLPYIVVAIIARVGRLPWQQLRRLAVAGMAVLTTLWGLAAVLIFLLAQALPSWEVGSFYSATVIEQPESPGFVSQIIAANPFEALAAGTVPAVVLFCILTGLALVGMPHKMTVVSLLETAEQVMHRVNSTIVRATPVGVFAISASTAGTIQVEEVERLQGYFLLQVAAALLLVLWVIPAMIAACTPLRYREVVGAARAIILTAFATGKVLVVLPLIINTANKLLERLEFEDEEARESADAIVPLAYAFPHLGRLLALLFIPFAGWFIGDPMDLVDYPYFIVTGSLAMFGSVVVGIPYLLDAQRLPADLFQLFLASGVICGRLSDAVGAMHFLAVALITPCILSGNIVFKPRRLLGLGISGAVLIVIVITGSRAYLGSTLKSVQSRSDVLARMNSPLTHSGAIVRRVPPREAHSLEGLRSRVDRFRRDGVLRVGYHPDNLPYSFFNAGGALVGFDIDMAHLLAEDLGLKLELVPFEFETLAEQLERGDFDVAMSGIGITPRRLLRMSFSEPYFDATLAFVVKDHLRRDFAAQSALEQLKNVRIAVPRSDYQVSRLAAFLPRARVIRLASPREFFERDDVDAMLATAEAGSAWTIQHPSYSVAVPQPLRVSLPLAYATPLHDERLTQLLDHWVALKRGGLDYDLFYDHWILGKSPNGASSRWCIIRDVLHWVD